MYCILTGSTTNFCRERNNQQLCWPVFEVNLSWCGLRSDERSTRRTRQSSQHGSQSSEDKPTKRDNRGPTNRGRDDDAKAGKTKNDDHRRRKQNESTQQERGGNYFNSIILTFNQSIYLSIYLSNKFIWHSRDNKQTTSVLTKLINWQRKTQNKMQTINREITILTFDTLNKTLT